MQLLQSVKTPKSYFKKTIPNAKLALCKNADGVFLCKVLVTENKAVTFDKSVKLILPSSAPPAQPLSLEVLEDVPQIFDEVELTVEVDMKELPERLSALNAFTEAVQKYLRLFVFSANSEVSFERVPSSFGIKKVVVQSATGSCKYGSVSSTSTVKVIERIPWNPWKHTVLIGFDNVENTLKPALEDAKNLSHRHFLLIGPSGSGKSTFVRNLALKTSIFEITSQEVLQPFPGDTEKLLKSVFQRAAKLDKAVVFIKNIETLCPKEIDPKDGSHVRRISYYLMTLLEEMREVFVVATTSNVEALDTNVRRPGRIDEELLIRMLDAGQRYKILENLLKTFENRSQFTADIAQRTNGFTGSDLVLLANHLLRTNEELLSKQNVENCLRVVQPSALKGQFESQSRGNRKTFDSIGGMEDLKKSIKLSVLGPLQHPEAFSRFNLPPPRGILLYGPPGCAKTTIAQCIASETHMHLLSTSAAEIYSPYVGKAEKFIVKIFNQARLCAPSIIFLDEIDALVGNRSGGASNDVQTRILSALLTEMDGICGGGSSILVIAATNRPDMIDDALMRPGRFDKLIHVPAPNVSERLKILQTLAKTKPFDDDVNLEAISESAVCFSGADVVNLCNEAALAAATESLEATKIRMSHFEFALSEVRPSLTQAQIDMYSNFKKCGQMTLK